jgi:hypothetical protein
MLYVYLCFPLTNFRTPEQIFMKLVMYIMAPEPISTVYFKNPSHKPVSLCILPAVARQRLGKHVPTATKNFEGVIFYEVRVVSKEYRRIILPGTSYFKRHFNTELSSHLCLVLRNSLFH